MRPIMSTDYATPATTFSQFTRLPFELREMILMAALPGPRIVFLQHRQEPHFEFTSQSTLPLLDFCQGTIYRRVTKGYTKAFGTKEAAPSTWINFDIDALYLDWGCIIGDGQRSEDGFSFSTWDLGDDVHKVRNLAIYNHGLVDGSLYEWFGPGCDQWIAGALGYFGNVQTLTLAAKHHAENETADLLFLDEDDLFEIPRHHNFESYHPMVEVEFKTAGDDFSKLKNLDIEALEARRTADLGSNGLPEWTMPKIERKLVLSSRRKAIYEVRRKFHDQKMSAWKAKVTLNCPTFEPLELEVSLNTPFAEMVSSFCTARNVDAARAEDYSYVLTNPGIVTGADALTGVASPPITPGESLQRTPVNQLSIFFQDHR